MEYIQFDSEYIELPDIPLEEFNFLACDEFVGFDEKIYDKICRTPYEVLEKYLNKKYKDKIKAINKYTDTLVYKLSNNNELELIWNERYSDDYPCMITIYPEDMTIEIINLVTLIDEINKINHRYYPMVTIINNAIKNQSGHAVLLLFDKYTKTAHLIDSNNEYGENTQITEILTKILDLIDYMYIPSNITNFMKPINTYNNEINAQEFFKGYCMPYSIILTELFLITNNEEPNEIIKKLIDLKEIDRNELMNRYQLYLYIMFYQ